MGNPFQPAVFVFWPGVWVKNPHHFLYEINKQKLIKWTIE